MRFLIIVKATTDSAAGAMPDQRIFDAMADYHQQLQEAGVLLDASGLQPSAKGWRANTPAESAPSSTAPSPRPRS